MTAPADQKLHITDIVPMKLQVLGREFSEFLIFTPKEDGEKGKRIYTELELQQMALAKEVLPQAEDNIALAFSRLIGETVKDPDLLINLVLPRHIDLLGSYGWVVSPDAEERAEHNKAGMEEGWSSFWLCQATNKPLSNQEEIFRPLLAPAFFTSSWQYFAVRAWLRLQCFHMDITKIDLIKDIWALRWPDGAPSDRHDPIAA